MFAVHHRPRDSRSSTMRTAWILAIAVIGLQLLVSVLSCVVSSALIAKTHTAILDIKQDDAQHHCDAQIMPNGSDEQTCVGIGYLHWRRPATPAKSTCFCENEGKKIMEH